MRDTTTPPVAFIVPKLLSPDECASWIAETEATGYRLAPITTARGPVINTSVRSNHRVMLDDPARAAALWPRLEPHLPKLGGRRPVGLNERLRFYRYEPGQHFDWHLDGCYRRPNGEQSELTVLLYLSEDFDGGATGFDDARVQPATGLALLFRHRILHCGEAVTRGRKYVLRTDVMYEPAG